MGISLIFGAISAVVGIVGAIGQANAASEAAAAQRESRDINAAQNKVNARDDRRSRIREERIRRARIQSAAENVGTSRSSGEVGAIGALSTNLAGLFGQSYGQSNSNAGMNAADQRSADAINSGNMIGAFTGAIQSGISGFSSVFDKKTNT